MEEMFDNIDFEMFDNLPVAPKTEEQIIYRNKRNVKLWNLAEQWHIEQDRKYQEGLNK